MKKLFTYLILATALCFTPALSENASARIELSEPDNAAIKIEQNGSTLIVTGAAGKTVRIYNLIGMTIMSVKIDANEKKIDLSQLTKGIYPVKVGNVSKKLHIQER